MRSSFSLPLAGAAAITVGAVVFGLLRSGGRREAAPAPAGAPGAGVGAAGAASPSLPDPAALEANLLDRLRSRGF